MTAPTVVPVLDEQTVAELQPPCDCLECARTASWGMTLRCPCRSDGFTLLVCGMHRWMIDLRRRDLTCMMCGGAAEILRTVRL